MKDAGLVETDPNDDDMHVRLVRLTEAGEKALAEFDTKEQSK